MTVVFEPFACPVCGHVREISSKALRQITIGRRGGECPPGQGCRAPLTQRERHRRWWLRISGVPDVAIRQAGSAGGYVEQFGLPRFPTKPAGLHRVVTQRDTRPEGTTGSLSSTCFRVTNGDPLLALSLAVEIIARGLPIPLAEPRGPRVASGARQPAVKAA